MRKSNVEPAPEKWSGSFRCKSNQMAISVAYLSLSLTEMGFLCVSSQASVECAMTSVAFLELNTWRHTPRQCRTNRVHGVHQQQALIATASVYDLSLIATASVYGLSLIASASVYGLSKAWTDCGAHQANCPCRTAHVVDVGRCIDATEALPHCSRYATHIIQCT
jgi:hypothetical protein